MKALLPREFEKEILECYVLVTIRLSNISTYDFTFSSTCLAGDMFLY